MSRRGENIRKRKDGRWEGRYSIKDNKGNIKSKSVYGHTYSEVKQKLMSAKSSVPKTNSSNSMTIDTLTLLWLSDVKLNRKESTYQKYESICEKYIKPIWGSLCTDTIQREQIMADMPKDISESIAKSIICVINAIFNYGGFFYGTESIHLSYKNTSRKNNSTKTIQIINITDQHKLLEVLLTEPDIYKLGILLCLYMGLRLGEICALKWEDIDIQCRIMHIKRTVQRLKITDSVETTEKKTILYESQPKTVHSIREIPIPDILFQKLLPYYKEGAYIFGKNSPMDPRTYQYKFKAYLKKADIEPVHFHSLRHTFATNCISNGADVKSVSEILGHANVNITLNRYVHPAMETKRNIVNSIHL